MDEKLEKVQGLVIAAHKLLLQVLEENTDKDPTYKESYTDKMYEAAKMLLDVTRKLK